MARTTLQWATLSFLNLLCSYFVTSRMMTSYKRHSRDSFFDGIIFLRIYPNATILISQLKIQQNGSIFRGHLATAKITKTISLREVESLQTVLSEISFILPATGRFCSNCGVGYNRTEAELCNLQQFVFAAT